MPNKDTGLVDGELLTKLNEFVQDEDMPKVERLLADHLQAVERKAEIALARKVIAVSGGHHKIKGFTQAKRLKLLTDKMNEIIPDEFGIVEEQN